VSTDGRAGVAVSATSRDDPRQQRVDVWAAVELTTDVDDPDHADSVRTELRQGPAISGLIQKTGP